MEGNENTTLRAITEAAKTEFSEKGFRGASLRNIVKKANVTTGAFYGYFKSKEELFDALVGEQAEHMMNTYIRAQESFAALTPEEQLAGVGSVSGECMDEILEYIYRYPVETKLILCCSEGTKYENFVHEMVEIEAEATHKFNSVLQELGIESRLLNPKLEHILISGMFAAYFEMIIHDMPYDEARGYLKELRMFYTAGWQSIMGF